MCATQPQAKAAVKAKAPPAPPPWRGPPLLGPTPRFPGMNPALHAKLNDLCGPRWVDVLFHLPSRILDRTAAPTVASAPLGERATLLAKVIKRPSVASILQSRNSKRPFVVELADDTGSVRAVFFHPGSWLERAFVVGSTVVLSGKMEEDSKGRKMLHPDVWSAGTNEAEGLAAVAKVWPLYPLTAGIPQGWVNRAVRHALAFAAENPPPEWLPSTLVEQHQLPTFVEALTTAHSPATEADLAPTHPARVRLALDELVATQLAL
ncbi:MAG: OB-fold nucleic acid binding domain-containing protein, partial [Alphaproteobacteria bacterium]